MIYYLFLSVNAMTYYAMTTLQTFSAIILRLSSVFELEENESMRSCEVTNPIVKIENANFSWGFKVKQENSKKAVIKSGDKVELEKITKPVLTGISIDMKPGDFLAVVGQVGSGKTSFL